MRMGRIFRIGAGLVLSVLFTISVINTGAPSTPAQVNHYHKAVADGFIGTLSQWFLAAYDWVENNTMYYVGRAGGWVYDHTNPCATQNCNH